MLPVGNAFGLDWLVSNDFSVTCISYAATELTRDAVSAAPISLKVGDACDLSEFADDSFDIVHSNSVIEHVGSWAKMSGFAKEVRRLAPAYYVQTPNFWFPVDPHFYRVPMIHWLPPAARASVHCKVKAGWAGPAKDVDSGMRLAESNNMLSLTQMKHLSRLHHLSLSGWPYCLSRSSLPERIAPIDLEKHEMTNCRIQGATGECRGR